MNKLYRLLSGIIVIFTTILLYVLLVDSFFKVPMAYIALSSVLISELITFGCFAFLKDNYKGYLLGAVFGIQSAATIIISLIFINIFLLSYVGFTVIYLVTFVLALLISLFIISQKANIDKDNSSFKNAKISCANMRAVVNGIINSESANGYQAALKKLDEDIRFMDDSVTDDMDCGIYNAICDLRDNIGDPDFDAKKAIESIENSVKQRNFVVKSKKSYN